MHFTYFPNFTIMHISKYFFASLENYQESNFLLCSTDLEPRAYRIKARVLELFGFIKLC